MKFNCRRRYAIFVAQASSGRFSLGRPSSGRPLSPRIKRYVLLSLLAGPKINPNRCWDWLGAIELHKPVLLDLFRTKSLLAGVCR